MHLSRDSTDIPVRERGPKKKATERLAGGPSKKKGQGKCELQVKSGLDWRSLIKAIPTVCDSGSKVSSRGSRLYWRGYKLHVDVDDSGFPIACALSSASTNDSILGIPLSMKSSDRVRVYYELMDKGYYVTAITGFIEREGRVPIIAQCPKNKKTKEDLKQEELAMKTLNWTPAEKVRFRFRTSVERFFSQLKDNFACRQIRFRGHAKVYCHLMFSVIALAADQLVRLLS